MNTKTGRVLLSVAAIATLVVPALADLNTSHIFNPQWTPHAKFHDIVLLCMTLGLSPIALWLLWRQSPDKQAGITVAALIPGIFWGAFFIAVLVPGSALTDQPGPPPLNILGVRMHPNIVLAGIVVVLTVLGYWLYRRGDVSGSNPGEAA